MPKKTIEEYKYEIREALIVANWFKAYNLALLLLDYKDVLSQENRCFCYICLSIVKRNMDDSHAGAEFGYRAIELAHTQDQKINARNALANCYVDIGQHNKAVEIYNECILICDEWLDKLEGISRDVTGVIFGCKADAIHNKGDLLNDAVMVRESILWYRKSMSSRKGNDKKKVSDKIANAYSNLDRILHSSLFTPISQAF